MSPYLMQSLLGNIFWAESLSYACHLINRIPLAAINGKTPLEAWWGGVACDYDTFKLFKCSAYYSVKKDKLDSRAKKAIFVGSNSGVKGYKLWDLKDRTIILSRDATFDETSLIRSSNSS